MAKKDDRSLEALKKSLLEDGVIDAEEVAALRQRLFANGSIDEDGANFLFDLNDAVTGNANDASWAGFFVEAICAFLLDDEATPGEIDEQEAKWLLKRIEGDGQYDETEKALLREIKARAKGMAPSLRRKLDEIEI